VVAVAIAVAVGAAGVGAVGAAAGGGGAVTVGGASAAAESAAPASAAGAAGTPAAPAAAPRIEQMVVFRNGDALPRRVSTAGLLVRAGRRRCAVGDATALAALVRSRPGRLRVRDFGSCSRRPRDAGGLFVESIRSDRNRGQNGWVYKVGRRGATAGAADPSGPFGNGRLETGRRVTWFYCRLRDGGCQRTLELRLSARPGGVLAVVRGYDDEGRGVAVAGADVSAGGMSALTGADGSVELALPAGSHRVVARKAGLVRSFPERVELP
jgi:hypothetical protein